MQAQSRNGTEGGKFGVGGQVSTQWEQVKDVRTLSPELCGGALQVDFCTSPTT